jgi:aspartyl aminopeptidase
MSKINMFEEISDFLWRCATPYHFCAYCRSALSALGFVEVEERRLVQGEKPKRGFIIRDERCIFAWNDKGHQAGVLAVSHCDSPCLILKKNADQLVGTIRKLRCSTYGGGTWHTWVDRPLRMLGQVNYKTESGIQTVLFDSGKAIAVIPSVAVHFSIQNSLTPKFDAEEGFNAIYGGRDSEPIMSFVANRLGISPDSIIGSDLRLMSAEPACLFSDNLFSAQQLDNLANTFACLKAFLQSEPEEGYCNCLVSFDNEEIGSLSRGGALGPLVNDCLDWLFADSEALRLYKTNSILLSCDSNHATHPNYLAVSDAGNPVKLGDGFTIEVPLGQSLGYSEAAKLAVMKASAKVGSRLQMRTELLSSSGSTVGPICEVATGIPVVDVGIAQLAMHSIREFGCGSDVEYELRMIQELYSHFSEHRTVVNK